MYVAVVAADTAAAAVLRIPT